jgi:hypothetical protein
MFCFSEVKTCSGRKSICVRFEVFTAVTTKKAVFWDVTPCSSGVNRRFGGRYRLHLQGRREIIRKSARKASVRDVKGHIPEDCFLQEYMCLTNGMDKFTASIMLEVSNVWTDGLVSRILGMYI